MVLALFSAVALMMALFLLSLHALSKTGVPVRATPPEAVQAALDLLALKDGERFADLGCAFGQVLRAARARADVEARGWELNPFAAAVAFLRSDRRTKVRFGDFLGAPTRELDAVYFYLMPRFLERHQGWLEQAFAPGTRVVAIDFPVPGWKSVDRREVGPLRQPVHLYVIGRHR